MRKVYLGERVEVSFDLDLCIHVGECLRGHPGVFRLGRKPWVLPDAGAVDDVEEVVRRCPSGALLYRRLEDGTAETYPATTVTPIRNGPLLVRGEIEVRLADGSTQKLPRATLCRCGRSEHKPFCDNQHLRVGFEAPGVALKVHLTPVRPGVDKPIAKSEDPRGSA